jgi:hypothetical protein
VPVTASRPRRPRRSPRLRKSSCVRPRTTKS